MLVRLRHDADDLAGSELEHALAREVEGEVRFDRGARALYATDASNYRQVPIGLVVPRTVDALAAAVGVCRAHDVPIVMRGGGTSLAGQTCNHAVVIDTSRHLKALEIDAEAGIARVEPGTIMTALRQAAQAVGWDFGPDPSTRDRCTLGGMLGNNSCGVHSVYSEFYGPGPRTSDHVLELDVLTYRGERLRARELDARHGPIHAAAIALAERYAGEIRARFPDMPRRVSGYNFPDLLAGHLGRALVGSEATCAIVLGATLQLARALPARSLCVIGYPDIFAAAEAANAARALRPTGCEAFDDVLAGRLRHHAHHDVLELLPRGNAWLFVECGADTPAEAHAQAERAARLLDGQGTAIYDDAGRRERLSDMRERALGVDAFLPGRADTHEGWEDSAVPPPRLAAYLRELRRLYSVYNLHGSLYGHFGQGCVHTRIDFDLEHRPGIERYREFTADAARLVVAHGGSLSGEHGDGQSRADLHEIMFGPELVRAFGEWKTLWDPDHRLNPGKLAPPPNPRTADLRLVDYHPHPGPIELVHGDDARDFGHAAVRCVGIGKCRKLDSGAMCPSYMVTLDERHSTRGRAHLLFEMLRGDVIKDGWRSTEVREALDLCLACKACKSECPTHVDMASYKAEFMAHHYAHRVRPRQAYAFGRLHTWLGLAQPLAPVANLLGKTRLARWLAGVAPERSIPHIARRSFRATFRPQHGRGRRVILWPDTFCDSFHPEILHAAAALLARAGYDVHIPRARLCCGRPLFEFGWLESARRLWRDTLATLGPDIDAGTPVVGVEPSCVAAFRDELLALFPDSERAERLSRQTFTLGELLRDWTPPASAHPRRILYHRHCHQAAVLDAAADVALLTAAGHDVRVLDSGCCGMAGPFGFQHYQLSRALAERVLVPAIRADPDALVVADGFSCREQLHQLIGLRARHSAEAYRLAEP